MHRLLRLLPPEMARNIVITALKYSLVPRYQPDPAASTTLFGKVVPNRIGIAAGLDKNAEALRGLFKLGFGFVEAGTVTPLPRAGNPGTRHWRWQGHNGGFNFYGLNSCGLDEFRDNLIWHREQYGSDQVIGASIGNPANPTDYARFTDLTSELGDLVDYFTVNYSCPNSHEETARSEDVLHGQVLAAKLGAGKKPVLVKLAPIFTKPALLRPAAVAVGAGADGFVCANTATANMVEALAHAVMLAAEVLFPGQPFSAEIWKREILAAWPIVDGKPQGGYSGPELLPVAVWMIATLRTEYPNLMLMGVGGVQSREAANLMFNAGADAVQLYQGLAVKGLPLVKQLVCAPD